MKLKTIIKYYLLWQLAIILITTLSGKFLPLRRTFTGGEDQSSYNNPYPYDKNPILYFRANFDGIHYISIARRGFGYAQQAFFPLYPKLLSLLNPVFKNFTITGVYISSLSFLLGLYFFSKIILLDYSASIQKWTLITLLIFPVSFFFTSVYTEGLFFLLVILSFYCARTKHWWLAGIFGALAANTRFIGIFLFPALLIEWWPQRNIRKLLPLLLIPLGLISYMVFLQKTVGDSIAFIHAQQLFGQGRSDKIILIYQVFWRYLRMLFTVNRSDPLYLTIILEFIMGFSFLALSLFAFIKKVRPSYIFFNIAAYLVPTLTGSFTSLPRYVLICFPSFIILGMWLHRTSRLNRLAYFSISCLGFILFLTLFSRGYWVS